MTFGHRWTSQYGEEDDGTWLQALRGITPDQVRQALQAVEDSGAEWPPTLPQFKAYCRGRRGEFGIGYVPEVYRARAETDPSRLLTSDHRKNERAANLERFRRLVTGSLEPEDGQEKGRRGAAAEQASDQSN